MQQSTYKASVHAIRVAADTVPSKVAVEQVDIIPAGAGEKKKAQVGCVLFEQDRLATGPGVEVTLHFRAETEAGEAAVVEVIMGENARMEISSLSIFVGTYMVRTLVSAGTRLRRGSFDAKMKGAHFDPRGTAFTLVAPEGDAAAVLKVNEGTVEVSPAAPAAPEPSPSPAEGAATPLGERVAAGRPAAEDVVLVNQCQEAVISKDGRVLSTYECSLGAEFDRESEMAYASLPSYTAQYIIPSYVSDERRRNDFKKARRNAALPRENAPEAHETLAKVYTDLGRGKEALKELKKAKKARGGGDGDDDGAWEPSEQFLTLRGKAHLIDGELGKARADIEKALAKNPNSLAAAATLVGVSLKEVSEALGERDADKAGLALNAARTRAALLESQADSLIPAIRAVVLTILGDVSLKAGDLALVKSEVPAAAAAYSAAEGRCNRARAADPDNVYALKCLGDANRDLGTISFRAGQAARAASLYEQAEQRYSEAFAKRPDFSDVQYSIKGLSELRKLMERNPESRAAFEQKAEESYSLAVRGDPEAYVQEVVVPNILLKTPAGAAKVLIEAGLVPEVEGEGVVVVEQSLPACARVKKGTVVKIRASPDKDRDYKAPREEQTCGKAG
jgi:tetratricopeptide (TPR) repeat protein